jgi:hypothetical protein
VSIYLLVSISDNRILLSLNGKWNEQQAISISRARAALGRCKTMVATTGRHNVRVALELFDSIVASVYRFGLGVWGVNVSQVRKLDDLFADFVKWRFRFPVKTGRDVILANFGRRCTKCDSLYLASVQIATAASFKNAFWSGAVDDLRRGALTSKWFSIVCSELGKRGMREEVLDPQSTERQIRRASQIGCVLQRAGCAAVASQQQPSRTRRKMAGIT